ncbi:hypothetical protein [Acinetobacter sp. ANC 4648]|uniref:hypothetical protein n=1 Tax=Acinetobacter sp. ANC 4648 TaxID=1977875 RepID=UPI000A33BF6D|nr:hypothetical protein [Acinetobacter sp. ANC 4648]OTG82978.1 hypothetical protein B9T27_06830 [Acinetobacter sp. ANC 4648]
MAYANVLTFNKKFKPIVNTSDEGAYINRAAVFEFHQVKVVVIQENQKQELLYQVTLENTLPTAKISKLVVTNSQSIVAISPKNN